MQWFEEPGNERRAGDEGQRMNVQIRQALQRIGQFPRGKGAAFVAVGDITVLAVDAAERAAGEKDRAGAEGAGDRRLLPQMGGRAGDEQLIAEAAETVPDGAVSLALPRAERTGRIIVIHDVIIGPCSVNGNGSGLEIKPAFGYNI